MKKLAFFRFQMFLLLGISVFLKTWIPFPHLETVRISWKNMFFFKNVLFCVVLDRLDRNPFENKRSKFEKKCSFPKQRFSFKAISLYKMVFINHSFWSIYLLELPQNSCLHASVAVSASVPRISAPQRHLDFAYRFY